MLTRAFAVGALSVAVIALGVGVWALVEARKDGVGSAGEMFSLGSPDQYTIDEPVLFEDGNFYLVRRRVEGSVSFRFSAFYRVVPHLVFGLQRGCRVEWRTDVRGTSPDRGNALFVDPCSQSQFSIEGERVYGPAVGNLYEFPVYPLPDTGDVIVDTRILLCDSRELEGLCRRPPD